MRLFTAIDIPTDLTEALRSFVSRLRPTAKISWSPVENLHVTTKFIGEWPEPCVFHAPCFPSVISGAGSITKLESMQPHGMGLPVTGSARPR